MRNLILTLFLILSALVKPAFAATAEFRADIPEGWQESLDEQLKAEQNSSLSIPYSQIESSSSLSTGSWWATGYGPGTLQFQDDIRWSDDLSGLGNGFMTNINYHWNGNFNGWSDTEVHLCMKNAYNVLLGCADVTSVPTGSISVPYGSYAANNKLVFGFWVNRSPKLRIYNGPSLNYVSASVEYQ